MTARWNADIAARVRRECVDGREVNAYFPRPRDINAMFDAAAARDPERIALIEGERHTSYRSLASLVAAVARWMADQAGVGPSDRVAILCRNTHVFCVTVFAALRLGAVVAPISTRLKPQEALRLLARARPRLVVTEDPDWQAVLQGSPWPLRFVRDCDDLPCGANDPLVPAIALEEAAAFLMFTSGTTGKPKGALLTHRNVVHGVLNYHLAYGIGAADTTVIAVPIFHGTGLMAQLLAVIGVGGTVVLLPRFSAEQTLALIAREKATYFHAPPTVFSMLLQARTAETDVRSLTKLVVGGAPLPPALYRAVRDWVPGAFFLNTYGLTEATSPALMTPLDLAEGRQGQSVGIASPCMEARIVDPESGADLPDGAPGELWLSGSLVCRGYWENPEATRQSFADGWLRTGDVARRDREGFLTICDRIKDMIDRGGEKIFSVEVEDVLLDHPDVAEAAVLPAPDPVYGEIVRAVIVLRPGAPRDAEALRQWVAKRIARFKVPQIVDFAETLPRNAAGKVTKQLL